MFFSDYYFRIICFQFEKLKVIEYSRGNERGWKTEDKNKHTSERERKGGLRLEGGGTEI